MYLLESRARCGVRGYLRYLTEVLWREGQIPHSTKKSQKRNPNPKWRKVHQGHPKAKRPEDPKPAETTPNPSSRSCYCYPIPVENGSQEAEYAPAPAPSGSDVGRLHWGVSHTAFSAFKQLPSSSSPPIPPPPLRPSLACRRACDRHRRGRECEFPTPRSQLRINY